MLPVSWRLHRWVLRVPRGRLATEVGHAGEDRGPAWALNPRARLPARETVGGATRSVVARELAGEDRTAPFERVVTLEPVYGEYRDRAVRTIPASELRPDSR